MLFDTDSIVAKVRSLSDDQPMMCKVIGFPWVISRAVSVLKLSNANITSVRIGCITTVIYDSRYFRYNDMENEVQQKKFKTLVYDAMGGCKTGWTTIHRNEWKKNEDGTFTLIGEIVSKENPDDKIWHIDGKVCKSTNVMEFR